MYKMVEIIMNDYCFLLFIKIYIVMILLNYILMILVLLIMLFRLKNEFDSKEIKSYLIVMIFCYKKIKMQLMNY